MRRCARLGAFTVLVIMVIAIHVLQVRFGINSAAFKAEVITQNPVAA